MRVLLPTGDRRCGRSRWTAGSLDSGDDAETLARAGVPPLYLDAGTPNSDLTRGGELNPRLMIGRTIGSGHFSPFEVPDQINAMLERFISVGVDV